MNVGFIKGRLNKLIIKYSLIKVLICFFILIFILVILIWLCLSLFSPKNYDECVLSKMEGQDSSLLNHARHACQRKFPSEQLLREGEYYKKGQLNSSWCDTTTNEITACLDENNTEYKITKVEMALSTKTCEQTTTADIYTYAVHSPLYGNRFKAAVPNAGAIKCMYLHWYGKKYFNLD